MTVVNMLQAKTHLSRLVGEIESGGEPDIVIARNGKPVSRIAPVDPGSTRGKRLGLLEAALQTIENVENRSGKLLENAAIRVTSAGKAMHFRLNLQNLTFCDSVKLSVKKGNINL